MSRAERARCLAIMNDYYRLHLPDFPALKSLEAVSYTHLEKYAHVTFFFNGGRETPYDNEDRILVPSPKVATYDLKPEMSAYEAVSYTHLGVICGEHLTSLGDEGRIVCINKKSNNIKIEGINVMHPKVWTIAM